MTPSEYFDALYGKCCSAFEGAVVVVDSDGKSRLGVYSVDQIEDVATFVEGRECFLKINLIDSAKMLRRSEYAIGAESEVTCIVAIALDIDCDKGGKYLSRDAMLAALDRMPCKPSLIVNSNGLDGGLHVYWILSCPHYVVDDADRARIKAIAQRWLVELRHISGGKIDGTANLDRLLRPAGSVRKSGNTVSALEYHSDRLYELDDFEILSAEKILDDVDGSTEGRTLDDLSAIERKRWEGAKRHCEDAPTGSRSEADYSLLLLAHELGLDRCEVEIEVTSIGKFAERQDSDYFERTWERAEKEWSTRPKKEKQNDAPKSPSVFQIQSVGQLIESHPNDDPELIDGMLRIGETMLLVASSKAKKTWMVAGLAYSIASGQDWLGRRCRQGRVLVIDCELRKSTLRFRYQRVANALNVDPGLVDVVSLRGNLMSIIEIAKELRSAISASQYSAIVLDALYRTLPRGCNENDNSSMQGIFNEIDSIAEMSNAACIVVHHMSKGDQSGKALIDLGAGAGAINRAVDCLVTMRAHKNPGQVVVETVCRSFSESEPMTIEWKFPLWNRSNETPIIKQQASSQERKREADFLESRNEILEVLKKSSRPTRQESLLDALSFGRGRAIAALNRLAKSGLIKRRDRKSKGSNRKAVYWQLTDHISLDLLQTPSGAPSGRNTGSKLPEAKSFLPAL